MFISLIGLSSFLFGWPFIFLLKISGFETLTVTSYYYLSLTQFKEIFICVIGASIFGFSKCCVLFANKYLINIKKISLLIFNSIRTTFD